MQTVYVNATDSEDEEAEPSKGKTTNAKPKAGAVKAIKFRQILSKDIDDDEGSRYSSDEDQEGNGKGGNRSDSDDDSDDEAFWRLAGSDKKKKTVRKTRSQTGKRKAASSSSSSKSNKKNKTSKKASTGRTRRRKVDTDDSDSDFDETIGKKARAIAKVRAFLAARTDSGSGDGEKTSSKKKTSKKKRSPRVDEAAQSFKIRTMALPLSFGDVPYKIFRLYIKKKEEGIGLRLQNVDNRLVVKGLRVDASDPLASQVHINDVIVAVNELESRSISVDKLVEALKWRPPVDDGMRGSVSQSIIEDVIRVTFARPLQDIVS